MIGWALGALRVLSARPALRNALIGGCAALALVGAGALYLARVRADAVAEVHRNLDAQENEEIQNAIDRSRPGARPSGAEFLDCLHAAGPGCL